MDMADNENHPRPRRTRQESAKHYDSTRKDLQLSEVLDVLQCYVDYGGGINCCVCGKLYKSRVCFIKHLWEHTVYWDLFAGDKNHMRVLSIQAALILYGSCQQPLRPIPVDSLLVTSPHSSEHLEASNASPKKSTVTMLSTNAVTPSKPSDLPLFVPRKPKKKGAPPETPETPPLIRSSLAVKRKTPPKLEFSAPRKPKIPQLDFGEIVNRPARCSFVEDSLQNPVADSVDESGFRTPEKQGIPFVIPKAPKKKCRRRLLMETDSVGSLEWNYVKRPQVNRCLVLTPEKASENDCWKRSDTSKRKRAE